MINVLAWVIRTILFLVLVTINAAVGWYLLDDKFHLGYGTWFSISLFLIGAAQAAITANEMVIDNQRR